MASCERGQFPNWETGVLCSSDDVEYVGCFAKLLHRCLRFPPLLKLLSKPVAIPSLRETRESQHAMPAAENGVS